MTTEAQRVERLRQWLNEFDGRVSNFCRQYDLPRARASYLSQILSGTRAFGERAARKLETDCGRPIGWLDAIGVESQKLKYDEARFNQLPQAERELVEGFIEFVLRRWEAKTMNATKTQALSTTEEFVPSAEQIEAVKSANRRPRKDADHGIASNRKRNAA